jgi:hypothetical protein
MLAILGRYRLRRLDYLALACTLIGVSGTTVLTLAQFGSPSWPLIVVGIVVIVVTVGGSALGLAVENEAQDARERATRRELAGALVEDLCRSTIRGISRCPAKTGAVVFLPDSDGVLASAYTFQKEQMPDRNLRFAKYEGATGHAWATGEQTWARLDEATEEDLARIYKLSPEYIRLTAHLKVVVATPIWSVDSPRRMLGVVSIDSEASPDASGLLSDESLEAALELAVGLARILTFAKLV